MAGNAALDHGYARSSFADDAGIRHDLYRAGSGPAVIVMHEIGGLNEAVVAVAERIRREGFSVVLPSSCPGRSAARRGSRTWRRRACSASSGRSPCATTGP
jgi:dienelactone hydrolase